MNLEREKEFRRVFDYSVSKVIERNTELTLLSAKLRLAIKELEGQVKKQESIITEHERMSKERDEKLSMGLASISELSTLPKSSHSLNPINGYRLTNEKSSHLDVQLEDTFKELAKLKRENERLSSSNDLNSLTFRELERRIRSGDEDRELLVRERSILEKQKILFEQELAEQHKVFENEKNELKKMLRSQQDTFQSTLTWKDKTHQEAYRKSVIVDLSSSPPLDNFDCISRRSSIVANAKEKLAMNSHEKELSQLVDRLSMEKSQLKEQLFRLQSAQELNSPQKNLTSVPKFDKGVVTERDPLQDLVSSLKLKVFQLEKSKSELDEKIQSVLLREVELVKDLNIACSKARKYDNLMRIAGPNCTS